MMADTAWKQGERRIAAYFGTLRTSLSGGNSKITRSDTMHDKLFIEAKQRFKHPIIKSWDAAKKAAKGRIPAVVLMLEGETDIWIMAHSDHLVKVVENMDNPDIYVETYERKKIAAIQLWKETKEMAEKEGKIPLVALQEKNRSGFWIIAHSDDIRPIIQELKNHECHQD